MNLKMLCIDNNIHRICKKEESFVRKMLAQPVTALFCWQPQKIPI